jgi:hypothetical protein
LDNLISQDILRSWTPDNRVTDIPSLTAANLNVINAGLTDRFVKKADFLRLRFLQFGYNLSPDALKNTGFRNIKIFGNAETYLHGQSLEVLILHLEQDL